MLGEFAGLMYALPLNLAQDLLKGLITAGIHLNTLTGSFFYNSMRKILYSMQEVCAGVISLFLMLWGFQHPVDNL